MADVLEHPLPSIKVTVGRDAGVICARAHAHDSGKSFFVKVSHPDLSEHDLAECARLWLVQQIEEARSHG